MDGCLTRKWIGCSKDTWTCLCVWFRRNSCHSVPMLCPCSPTVQNVEVAKTWYTAFQCILRSLQFPWVTDMKSAQSVHLSKATNLTKAFEHVEILNVDPPKVSKGLRDRIKHVSGSGRKVRRGFGISRSQKHSARHFNGLCSKTTPHPIRAGQFHTVRLRDLIHVNSEKTSSCKAMHHGSSYKLPFDSIKERRDLSN